MGKKKRMYTVHQKHEKKNVISGDEIRKATKNRAPVGFSTGKYMTEKDRPRKKKWTVEE